VKKVSRRDFVKQSAQWALVSVALGLSGAAMSCKKSDSGQKIIDVHVHADFQDNPYRLEPEGLARIEQALKTRRSKGRCMGRIGRWCL